MRKILITDDEKLTRAGICKIIRENFSDLEILEAKNGAEALEILHNNKIHILVTDIRMPVMSGIDLMNQIKEEPDCPAIIVLSGFDEFSYAKEAIKCGALAYILKPIDKAELISNIEKVIGKQQKTEQSSEEKNLSSVISEGRVTQKTQNLLTKLEKPFVCALTSTANKSIIENLVPYTQFFNVDETQGFFYSVFPQKYLEQIKATVTNNESNFSGVISFSSPESNISNIRVIHRQAFISYLSSFYQKEKTSIFTYTEPAETPDSVHALEQFHSITSILGISESQDIRKKITSILSFDSEEPSENAVILYIIYNEIQSTLIRPYWTYIDKDSYLQAKSIMIENILKCSSVGEWLNLLSDYTIYLNELIKQENSQYPFITKAIKYVKANFMKDINMSVVANHVDVNYTYFSETFKEQSGVNFNDYLKRVRIDNAKILIEKGFYKVYEIAELSGFKDTKYFIKIFKEVVGCTPSEYKKHLE